MYLHSLSSRKYHLGLCRWYLHLQHHVPSGLPATSKIVNVRHFNKLIKTNTCINKIIHVITKWQVFKYVRYSMEQLKIEFNNRVLKQSPYLTTRHRTGTMSWSMTITGSPTRCADVRLALRHIGCRSIPTNRCPSTTRSWWLYTSTGRGRSLVNSGRVLRDHLS